MYAERVSLMFAAAEKPPPDLPPQLQHLYVETSRRHRVDAVRRCIHAADLQRVLVFMNYQQTLQVCGTAFLHATFACCEANPTLRIRCPFTRRTLLQPCLLEAFSSLLGHVTASNVI